MCCCKESIKSKLLVNDFKLMLEVGVYPVKIGLSWMSWGGGLLGLNVSHLIKYKMECYKMSWIPNRVNPERLCGFLTIVNRP